MIQIRLLLQQMMIIILVLHSLHVVELFTVVVLYV